MFSHPHTASVKIACHSQSLQNCLNLRENPKSKKMLPFLFIFAEWYSESTSEKVRATFRKQAEQGKFLAAYAPYGYAGVIIGIKPTKPVNTGFCLI